jgi:ribosome-binding protein aMBF1 (putative translation factor)
MKAKCTASCKYLARKDDISERKRSWDVIGWRIFCKTLHMIKNEKQYRSAKAQAEKFAKTLKKFQDKSPNSDTATQNMSAYEEALQLQHSMMIKEIRDYERVRSRYTGELQYDTFDQIADLLIQARINQRLTHRELADKLGMKEQQIQRYEATNYRSASLSRLCEIAHILGINDRTQFRVDLDKNVPVASHAKN